MMHLANTLGGLLALAGFTEPGIRVALIMENVAEFVPTFYGVSFARAVNVLLNPMLTANELDFYLRSSAPRLVILTPSSPCKARVTVACEKLGISGVMMKYPPLSCICLYRSLDLHDNPSLRLRS
eukprot:jgi/Mesvir1/21865/Mv04242-RA.1